jgi:hypothetical protein
MPDALVSIRQEWLQFAKTFARSRIKTAHYFDRLGNFPHRSALLGFFHQQNQPFAAGTWLAQLRVEGFMKAQTFVHDHYSPQVGESPTGHAAAILGGLVLMAAGLGLMFTVALLPVGLVVGLLGLFIFGAGVFGHIRSPLTVKDLMDTIVGLAAAAIGMTFTLAIAAFVVGFGVTVLVLLFGWIRHAI